MSLKLLINFRSMRAAQYSGRKASSEPGFENGEIILFWLKLLASSFDPRACGELAAAAVKAGDCPDIAFYAAQDAGPGWLEPRTETSITATNWQPSKNLGMRVSNH